MSYNNKNNIRDIIKKEVLESNFPPDILILGEKHRFSITGYIVSENIDLFKQIEKKTGKKVCFYMEGWQQSHNIDKEREHLTKSDINNGMINIIQKNGFAIKGVETERTCPVTYNKWYMDSWEPSAKIYNKAFMTSCDLAHDWNKSPENTVEKNAKNLHDAQMHRISWMNQDATGLIKEDLNKHKTNNKEPEIFPIMIHVGNDHIIVNDEEENGNAKQHALPKCFKDKKVLSIVVRSSDANINLGKIKKHNIKNDNGNEHHKKSNCYELIGKKDEFISNSIKNRKLDSLEHAINLTMEFFEIELNKNSNKYNNTKSKHDNMRDRIKAYATLKQFFYKVHKDLGINISENESDERLKKILENAEKNIAGLICRYSSFTTKHNMNSYIQDALHISSAKGLYNNLKTGYNELYKNLPFIKNKSIDPDDITYYNAFVENVLKETHQYLSSHIIATSDNSEYPSASESAPTSASALCHAGMFSAVVALSAAQLYADYCDAANLELK